MAGQWKAQALEREAEQALTELAAYDPRGRVKLYCGRCGEWTPSDDERTLPEHHEKTHGARLVGSFEWMHSVGYGPLDDDEVAR